MTKARNPVKRDFREKEIAMFEFIFHLVKNHDEERNVFENNRLVGKEFILDGVSYRVTRDEFLAYLDWVRKSSRESLDNQ